MKQNQNSNLEKEEVNIPQSIFQNKKGIHIMINAKPNSKHTFVQYVNDENIGFCIKAPAHDNEANKELQRYLGQIFGLKPREVFLEQGSKCPSKVICLPSDKITIKRVHQLLKENSYN